MAESGAGNLFSKRVAMLFLGFATILFSSRNSSNPELQRCVSLMVMVAFSGLIGVGVYEYATDGAGVGIWAAIISEVVFAALFASVWRSSAP